MKKIALVAVFCIGLIYGSPICTETVNDPEDGSYRYDCFYEGKKLLEAYTDYKKANKGINGYDELIPTPAVGKNRTDTFKNGILSIEYKWDGDKKLSVTMIYEGGDVYLIFEESANGTKQSVVYSG
jgi:hypothetical protein